MDVLREEHRVLAGEGYTAAHGLACGAETPGKKLCRNM